MELEGLKRCIQKMKDSNLEVKALITDRHVMVKKYMKNDEPEIQHLFDIYHVAKGMENMIVEIDNKHFV